MLDAVIPVHETFGPTIQGEGFWTGALVDFVRLAGCPVGCPWCDTGYADGGKGLPNSKVSFQAILTGIQCNRVVISGGEPMIHPRLPLLVDTLLSRQKHVSIETSGAFWQPVSPLAWVTLSPKAHISPKYPVHEVVWNRANEIKLVIDDGSELDFYGDKITKFSGYVYLQPQWENKEKAVNVILKILQKYPHWKMSMQTHKFIGVQ